jgi:hypothetical protein
MFFTALTTSFLCICCCCCFWRADGINRRMNCCYALSYFGSALFALVALPLLDFPVDGAMAFR